MHALLLLLGPSYLLLLLYGLSIRLDRLLQLLVGMFPCILSANGETFGFTRGHGVQV
jgi:hypothetical protein